MGTRGGTGTVNEGLVLGYDTGAPLVTRDINTRTYQGQPTQNIITDTGTMSGWSSYGSGNDGTFTTEFGTTGYRMTSRLSWNGVSKSFTLPSTGTYSFSAWFKYKGGSSSNNGATVYVSSYGGSDTARAINKNLINQWQRIERVVNVTDVTVLFYLISYGGNSSVDRSSWEVTMPQIEKQPTRTPFVNGTRSSTQSLLDLKGSTDINVSNVSFDSNGLPTFDGTNDRITIPADSFPTIGTNNFTIEVISKNTKTSSYNHFFAVENQNHFALKMQNATNTDRNIYVYRTSTLSTFNAITARATSTTSYYHIVCRRDGDNIEIFLNGISGGTKSGWDNISIDNNTKTSYIGWGNGTEYTGGDIPVLKIYDRALSAQEIQQNYNAYKNRFNI